MAILSEVFEKVAAAEALDGEERVLWLNFLSSVMAAKDKVVPMAQGQSIVTALSQITNNAGRLTRGEYISPADANIPYPEDSGFTGVVQDSDGIRGLKGGKTQFDLRSSDGRVYSASGLMVIDSEGISYDGLGVFASTTPSTNDRFYIGGIQTANEVKRFGVHSIGLQGGASSELIDTNGDFSDGFTDWTQTGTPTLSTDTPAGGYSARVTASAYISRSFTTVVGKYYLLTFLHKNGTTSDISPLLLQGTGGFFVGGGSYFDADTWQKKIVLLKATATTSSIIVKSHGAYAALVKDFHLGEVLSYTYTGGLIDGMGDYMIEASDGITLKSPAVIIDGQIELYYSTTPTGSLSSSVKLYSKAGGELYKYSGTTEFRLLTTLDLGSIDSGATLPISPTANQLFMHTPTGRRVLTLYTNSAWTPLYSFGTMTVYVDGTSGTDAADKGTGTGANAWKTLSYAWTQLPSIFYGNITINVAAGTYAETLTAQGKMAGGAFTITIQGAEDTAVVSGTMTSAVQGTGATPGSITDTALSMTVDAYKGYFIKYGSTIRVVKSNTADTFSIAGTFPGTPSGTYTVFKPGTIIDGGSYGVSVVSGQSVTIRMVKFSGATSREINLTSKGNLYIINCLIEPDTNIATAQVSDSTFRADYCSILANGTTTQIIGNQGATLSMFYGTMLQILGTKSANGVSISDTTTLTISGHVYDNFSGAIVIASNSSANFFQTSGNGYNFITNNTTGISASGGGQAINTSNNQYSGNTTNENSDTSTFGAIGSPSQYYFPNNLFVDGSADEVQGRFQGHSTQTANVVTIESSAAAVQSSFDVNGGAVFNEQGNASGDVRMESDTEPNMFLLNANGDTDGSIQLGGTTNSTKYLKGGRYSHLGTARKTWTKHTAASVTVTAGTSASVVAALQTMADGSFYTLTEAAATPGMDLIVDFTSISAFEKCRVLGGYNGIGSHAVAIQVYNWSTAAWDTFNAMQVGTWNITTAGGYILGNYEFRVYDDTNYIGTGGDAGKVRIRFYHTMAGNSSYSLYLDEVSLRQ